MNRAASIPPGATDSYAVSEGVANSCRDSTVGDTVMPRATATAITAQVRRAPRTSSPSTPTPTAAVTSATAKGCARQSGPPQESSER